MKMLSDELDSYNVYYSNIYLSDLLYNILDSSISDGTNDSNIHQYFLPEICL